MPAQAVFVEERPDDAEAEGCGRENDRQDTAAHGIARRVVVGEGAEADAGVAHSGGRVGEGEEEVLVDQAEQEDSSAGGDSGGLEGQVEAAGGEARGDEREGRGEEDESEEDSHGVDGGGHEAEFERGHLEGDGVEVLGLG